MGEPYFTAVTFFPMHKVDLQHATWRVLVHRLNAETH